MKRLIKAVGTVALILLLAFPVCAQMPEWEKLDREAIRLHAAGSNDQAEDTSRRAIAAAEKANGPQHPSVATCLSTLVEICSDMGLYEQTVPYIERILTIFKKQSGSDSPDVATAMSGVADSFRAEGRYAQAEPLYKRVLAIREKELGPDHPEVAASLCNLADVYQNEKRYAEAEPLYKRSLAIREKALGPDHPDVALTLNNFGMLLYIQGKYAEAEPLLKRALAMDEKTRGPESDDVAEVLNNLAELYRAQGKYAQAIPFCERSVAIQEKLLGPNHPEVAESLKFLAGIYRKDGQIAEADKLEARAAKIQQAAKISDARAADPPKPLITNHEAPGNPEAGSGLGCVSREEITNRYTPVELYVSASRCIEQERYKESILLFTLAGVYARFDTYRVDDETVGGAGTALVLGIFGPLDQNKKDAFSRTMKDEDGTPEKLAAQCKEIMKIGPPDYYPRYMVRHGMNAYMNKVSGDGLVKNFDATLAWRKALDTYLHCPNLE